MNIRLYDRVLLKTGEAADIVEIYEQGVAYEAVIDRLDGDVDNDIIKQEDIQKVIRSI